MGNDSWIEVAAGTIWRHKEDQAWKIVKTMDIGYVIDHPSIPYPRLEYIMLSQAMQAAEVRLAQWQSENQAVHH
jgi:hypothetical protein